jgi:hypothetical protein
MGKIRAGSIKVVPTEVESCLMEYPATVEVAINLLKKTEWKKG